MAVVMVYNSSLKSFYGNPMQYIDGKTIDLALENYFLFRQTGSTNIRRRTTFHMALQRSPSDCHTLEGQQRR